jgi:hypothetical protein
VTNPDHRSRASSPHWPRRLLLAALVGALAWSPGARSALAMADAPQAAPGEPSGPAAEDGVRKVWDVLFWRPVYVVQLVGGVAALPVALPLAATIGDWRDGVDMCVTGPFAMAFERPLGQ